MSKITQNTQPEIIVHDQGKEFDDTLDVITLDVTSRDEINEKDDPKQWMLDDIVCTPDFSKVLTVKGISTERNSGLTVTKLRTFCSVVPGLPKGYSNANKDALLTMLSNRVKGKVMMGDFVNTVETRDASVPLVRRQGKKPSVLTKTGTLFRFINCFFHQELKDVVNKLRSRLTMSNLDKR